MVLLATQSGRITSFFAPLNPQPAKASDTQLNSLERPRRTNEIDQPVQRHPKATLKRATVTQARNLRNGATPQQEDRTSQASASTSDTKQVATAPVKTSQETRTLRSKEKSLYKSELSMYFANYEDIMTDAPQSPEFLEIDEPIYIVDEPAHGASSSSPIKAKTTSLPSRPRAPSTPFTPQTTAGAQASASESDARTIHLPSPLKALSSSADPLGDDIYLIHHRRAERREKQLRNIEKERAQHEKAHLERILEGLQGPDWLRVLGVTGVTESEQKEWRPKRDYFLKEVSELVKKFRRWKDAERRLRLKKEREREEAEADDDEDSESDASVGASSSDLDARAAYQLLQEAGQTPRPPRRRKAQHVLYEAPPSPDQPFTGFYKDLHLRAQAMGEVRHGRHTTAFGVPLPDPPEEEFELYPEWTTHDTRRARERKRRKLKKEPDAQREFI
jgi:hypothetical protein